MSTQERIRPTHQPARQEVQGTETAPWDTAGGAAALVGRIGEQTDAIDAFLGEIWAAGQPAPAQGSAPRGAALQGSSNEAYIRAFIQTIGE